MKDHSARMQALQTQHSFIVQAPAGSGKTELLIQRLLALLAKAQKPEDVLAITFTKKAAGEMRDRLLQALERSKSQVCPDAPHQALTWQLAQAVLAQDAQQQWNLLEAPQQLRIQTIDAFCVYLTEQFPMQSDWGQGFQLILQAGFLYEKSVDLLFSLGEKSPCHSELLVLLQALDNDFDKCKTWLVSLLACRDQWLSFLSLNDSDEENKQHLESFLKLVIESYLQEIHAIFPQTLKSEWLALARLFAATLEKDHPSSLSSCLDLQVFPNCDSSNLPALKGLIEVLFTKSFDLRKKMANEWKLKTHFKPKEIEHIKIRFKALLSEFEKESKWQSILMNIANLPDPHYDEVEWQLLSAVLHILKTLLAILILQFRERKQIDTIENTQAAMRILGEEDAPSDCMLTLDYKIQHILVDEFQDTSPTQWHLLKKLIAGWQAGDGRTLFLVGDPMQSIYRFRDADVSLFLRIQSEGLPNIVIKPLYLSTNFRSCANLIEWTKTQFSQIFPKKNNLMKGEVCFIESEPANPQHTSDVSVSYHAIPSDAPELEISHFIELLNTLQTRFPNHSIAVLIRARTHAGPILQALQKEGIPFLAQDIEYLADRSYIRDLCALTLALHDLADRTHWLAVLRAPWCGMSLRDLEILSGTQPKWTILECLRSTDIKKNLSPQGQTQLEKIFPVLQTCIDNRERAPQERMIKQCWIALGGPATLPSTHALTDIDDYFLFLKHIPKELLQADYLEKKIRSLFARAQNHPNKNPIEIMTIHNAKGLEFDHVILFGLEKSTSINEKPLLTWIDQFTVHHSSSNQSYSGLLLASRGKYQHISPIYDFIHERKEDKIHAEIKRLFYVAVTRAKLSLHLFFQYVPDENTLLKKPNTHSLLALFYKQIPPSIFTATPKKEVALAESTSSESYVPRPLKRLVSHFNNPFSLQKDSSQTHTGKTGIHFDIDQHAHLGTLVHSALQKITQLSLAIFETYSADLKRQWLTRMAKHLVFPQTELNWLVNEALILIESMLSDQMGKFILSQDGESEKPISAYLEGRIRHLTVDRTYIDQHNIRWIIDYKTGKPNPHQSHKHFVEQEKKHHQPQLALYAKALKAIDDRKQIVGLYFLALPEFITFDEMELI